MLVYRRDRACCNCFIENRVQNTVQNMKFSIKDFFSKCDQIHRKRWIWSDLLKKSLMENLIFCAVKTVHTSNYNMKWLQRIL